MTVSLNSSRLRREPRWDSCASVRRAELPPVIGDYLLDRGSLTQRLRAACTGAFQVRLLRQRWAKPAPGEIRLLKLAYGHGVWMREVQLMCDDAPWVFARTLIPPGTLQGRCRRLKQLGVRPLGEVLFADPGVKRSEIHIARIMPEHALHQAAVQGLSQAPAQIWGRRSVFHIDGGPLLIYELFITAFNGQPCQAVFNPLEPAAHG